MYRLPTLATLTFLYMTPGPGLRAQAPAPAAAWLKFMENGMAKAAPAGTGESHDLTWMWEELGIAALRR